MSDAPVVVVTGGSSGIGRATCTRFHEEGYRIAVADVQEEPRDGGTPTHERIRADGGDATFVETDVRAYAAVEEMVDAVLDRWGRIDVLVNNAGFAEKSRIESFPVEDAHRILRVNVDGVFHGMRAVVPHMNERGSGSVVNIASVAGHRGQPEIAVYCGSKAAVIRMTEGIGEEVAGTGVTVNAVCPPRTRTAMTGFEGIDPEAVVDVVWDVSQAGYSGRIVDV